MLLLSVEKLCYEGSCSTIVWGHVLCGEFCKAVSVLSVELWQYYWT